MPVLRHFWPDLTLVKIEHGKRSQLLSGAKKELLGALGAKMNLLIIKNIYYATFKACENLILSNSTSTRRGMETVPVEI